MRENICNGVHIAQPLLQERQQVHKNLREALDGFAAKNELCLLKTPGNSISVALALDGLLNTAGENTQAHGKPLLTFLGSMLFYRRVSGTRVICKGVSQTVAGIAFNGYGGHHDDYPHSYITCAAALGTTDADIQVFLKRLETCVKEFRERSLGSQKP